ncbi:MAG: hypothetical protein WDO73_15920 [Ignavibacteriota bacterium]
MNGSVDVYFRSDPDADFTIDTMHGGVFADFDVTSLPTTVKGEIRTIDNISDGRHHEGARRQGWAAIDGAHHERLHPAAFPRHRLRTLP